MKFLAFGCTANFKEAELLKKKVNRVVEKLKKEGKINNDLINNFVFITSCAVKGPTENKILRIANDLKKEGKKVVITSCLALAYPEKLKKQGFLLIGENFLDEKEIEKLLLGINKEKVLTNKEFKDEKSRLELTGNKQEKIEINRGCLGNCSYCATKLAIPSFYSYKTEKIVDLIKKAYKKGVKEILLTSQDTGAFGLDNKENLLFLVKKINEWWFSLKNRRKDFFIRIGMMNPNFIKAFVDELLQEMEKGCFYRFIHLPIQSGSDKILKKMNRGYCVKEWLDIARKVKEKGFTLATDIIVAYPGEDEKDFKKSLELFDLVDIDVVNISKFWPRPKTKAYEEWKKFKIDDKIAKERAKKLKEKFEERLKKINEDYLKKHKTTSVLFNEYDEKRESLKGKDLYYKQIIVKTPKNKAKKLIWNLKEVELESFEFNSFFGKIKK